MAENTMNVAQMEGQIEEGGRETSNAAAENLQTSQQTQQPIPVPEAGETRVVQVAPGDVIQLGADVTEAELIQQGGSVLLRFSDGGDLLLEDFINQTDAGEPPTLILADGSEVTADQIIAAMTPAPDAAPAAGEGPTSGGAGEYREDVGNLIEGVNRLDGLGPDALAADAALVPEAEGEGILPEVEEDALPLAADDAFTIEEDPESPLEGDLSLNDDPGDAPATFAILDGPENGTATVNPDGTFSYTPSDNYNGPDSFTYTITDSDGDTDTATVTIEVTPVNDAPQALDNEYSTDEDSSVGGNVITDTGFDDELNVTGVDSDPENDPLTVTAVNGTAIESGDTITLASGALLTMNSDGTFTYNPNGQFEGLGGEGSENSAGSDTFTYTITDGDATSTADVTINVSGLNDAPQALDNQYSTNEDSSVGGNVITDTGFDDELNTTGVDSDPENDPLTVTAVNGTAINSGDTITLASGALLTMNSDGTFTYDPNGQFEGLGGEGSENSSGSDTFTYTITDGDATSTADVTINVSGVNDAPQALDNEYNTNEDSSVGGNVITDSGFDDELNVTGVDSDPENDPLTVTAVNGTAIESGDTITLASGALLTMNSDGTFTYDPNGQFEGLGGEGSENSSGSDTFTYTITDGDATSTADVTINVSGVNDGPQALDNQYSTDEDSSVDGNVITDIGVDDELNTTGVDSDPENDPLTVTAVNGTAIESGDTITLASGALLTMNSDGTFTYNPNGQFEGLGGEGSENSSGSDTFTYTITDGDATSTADVTINVSGVNDAPQALDNEYSTDEDSSVGGNVITDTGFDDELNVTGVDSDPENDPLTVTAVNGTAIESGDTITLASGALLTMNSDGTFTYDPNGQFEGLGGEGSENSAGSDTFTYTITDGNATSTADVTINVSGVNDPPIAVDDVPCPESEDFTASLFLNEGQNGSSASNWSMTNLSIIAYEFNGDNESDTLAYTQQGVGVLSDGENNPPNRFNELDYNRGEDKSESLQIKFDGFVNTSTVTLGMFFENEGPNNGEEIGHWQALLNGHVIAESDFDSTNDSSGTKSITIDTGDKLYNELIFTAKEYSEGGGNLGVNSDSSDYYIKSIYSSGPCDCNGPLATTEDAPTSSLTTHILSNDSDPENNTLFITNIDTNLTNGKVSFDVDTEGNITNVVYDPDNYYNYLNPGETATDTFSYTISDGYGGTDTAQVTIKIIGINDYPSAENDMQSLNYGHLLATNNTGATILSSVNLDPDAETTYTAINEDIGIKPDEMAYDGSGLLWAFDNSSKNFYTINPSNGDIKFQYEGVIQSDVDGISFLTINGSEYMFVLAGKDLYTLNPDNGNTIIPESYSIEGASSNLADLVSLNGKLYTYASNNNLFEISLNPDGSVDSVNTFSLPSTISRVDGMVGGDDGSLYLVSSKGQSGGTVTPLTIDNDGNITIESPFDIDGAPLGNLWAMAGMINFNTEVNGNVLDNDTDPENSLLEVTLVDGQSANVGTTVDGDFGSLTLNSDGTYTYTLDTDITAAGQDSFTYTISDGYGGLSSATLTFNVNGFIPTGSGSVITGDENDNILTGTVNNDILFGDEGNDSLTGDDGADTFVYSADGGEGQDTILDFNPGEDIIRLTDVLDSDTDGLPDLNELAGSAQEVSVAVNGSDVTLTIAGTNGNMDSTVTLDGINSGAYDSYDGGTLQDLIDNDLIKVQYESGSFDS
ncbi:beta strand repeat-containing protein [Desulfohalobium retbaense]|uniref:Type 1 secretion C-terminal target domain protein n=1 Tax=Desulfohalobium retbaense (strain ATCC 49708 / DSM 5692 / JCM 16813 / HR100) TaxID=485915 RepID=C8WYU4_DESRD|nr:Ig-like domain-containing protein [Desulfohalobium retbaense]ACV67860.1 type 1 secretion C-terminal target domain protein [Desulfohalobium retbaense DSM 5692]